MLGRVDVDRPNYEQLQPIRSSEWEQYSDVFASLRVGLQECYDWMCAQVSGCHSCDSWMLMPPQLEEFAPDLVKNLVMFVEALPAREASCCYPFAGYVLNFNIESNIHRDFKDLNSLCVAIPFGTFTGGALALLEPGLVIPVQAGDMILFNSADTTHFNLPYAGVRGSLILHSDSAGQQWVENRNQWDVNVFMS